MATSSMVSDVAVKIIATVVAMGIVYFFRHKILEWIDLAFFRVYPKLIGQYRLYIYDRYSHDVVETDTGEMEVLDGLYFQHGSSIISTSVPHTDLLEWLKEEDVQPYIRAEIKQFANRISGTIYVVVNGQMQIKEKFNGKVTASRIIMLHSESKTADHHNFGSYLLGITPNPQWIKGSRSFLCSDCGAVDHDYIFLEKDM